MIRESISCTNSPPPGAASPPITEITVFAGQQLLIERSDQKGSLTSSSSPLDPGFAYWASLPDSKVVEGIFSGSSQTDIMVITSGGIVYSEASTGDGTFRIFALGAGGCV
jgi:hypothetical protein